MNRLTFAIFNFIDAINFFEEHILCQNTIYENYAEEKKETKFTTYQHTESVIERVLFRDRTHPVDSVIINDFNQKTGEAAMLWQLYWEIKYISGTVHINQKQKKGGNC